MKILKILVGMLLVGGAYEIANEYSPIILIEGIFLINYGLMSMLDKTPLKYQ